MPFKISSLWPFNRKNQHTTTNPIDNSMSVSVHSEPEAQSPVTAFHIEPAEATEVMSFAISTHTNYRIQSADQVEDKKDHGSASAAIAVAAKPISNCVEFIYGVMDDLYPQLEAEYGQEEAYRRVAATIQSFYADFKPENLDRLVAPIQYGEPARQFAYLYRYAATRACALSSIVGSFPSLEEVFNRDHLDVCCIGGGPGTELISIAKHLTVEGKQPKVHATIIDREERWTWALHAIINRLSERLQIEARYLPFDFMEHEIWPDSIADCQADLYTLSYCLAEFRNRQPQVEPFFVTFLGHIPDGSYVLFMDNNIPYDQDWFDGLSRKCGLKLMPDKCGSYRPTHASTCEQLLSADEIRFANVGYREKWRPKTPSTRIRVGYRLCRKV